MFGLFNARVQCCNGLIGQRSARPSYQIWISLPPSIASGADQRHVQFKSRYLRIFAEYLNVFLQYICHIKFVFLFLSTNQRQEEFRYLTRQIQFPPEYLEEKAKPAYWLLFSSTSSSTQQNVINTGTS